ncbi:MAG: hypothetical protein ABSH20_18530, partial [Tepidisphaeraceae bacterium]
MKTQKRSSRARSRFNPGYSLDTLERRVLLSHAVDAAVAALFPSGNPSSSANTTAIDEFLASVAPGPDGSTLASFVATGSGRDLTLLTVNGVLEYRFGDDPETFSLTPQTGTGAAPTLGIGSTTHIVVKLGDAGTLTVDSSLDQSLQLGGSLSVTGGADSTLKGPSVNSTWDITGKDSGTLNSHISYTNITNLTGAANNDDLFVFGPYGRISGVVDGGPGGYDSMVINSLPGQPESFYASGRHSGVVVVGDNTIHYAGLEPVIVPAATTNVVVNGTAGNDQLILEDDPTHPGLLRVRSGNNTMESVSFTPPTGAGSITIDGLDGTDSLEIANNVSIPGAALAVNAETITVDAGVTITAASVKFNAIDTESLPAASAATTRIEITGASITAGSVSFIAASTLSGTAAQVLDAFGGNLVLANAASSSTVAIDGNSSITSTGAVMLSSSSTVNIVSTATAAAAAPNNVDAASATSKATSTAISDIAGTAAVHAGGLLSILANNAVTINSTATGGGGSGGSVALSKITGVTKAFVDTSATASAGSVNISATSANNLTTSATSSTGGTTANDATTQGDFTTYSAKTNDGSVGVAAALAITDLSSTNQAYVASTGGVTATGTVALTATSSNNGSAIADGSATATNGPGVGVAVGIDTANITNQADISGSVSGHGVSVQAITPAPTTINTFTAGATAGAGATTVGVAGALALNKISSSYTAQLQPTAIVNANGGTVLLASTNNSSANTTGNGVQTGTGKVGVGAAFALDVEGGNITDASLQNGATLNNAGSLTLTAQSSNTSATTATAGAAGGIAVSPAIALSFVTNTTDTTIGSGTTLTVTGLVDAEATHTGSDTVNASGTAAGSKVGVGAAIALGIPTDTTTSTTNRSLSAGGAVT